MGKKEIYIWGVDIRNRTDRTFTTKKIYQFLKRNKLNTSLCLDPDFNFFFFLTHEIDCDDISLLNLEKLIFNINLKIYIKFFFLFKTSVQRYLKLKFDKFKFK